MPTLSSDTVSSVPERTTIRWAGFGAAVGASLSVGWVDLLTVLSTSRTAIGREVLGFLPAFALAVIVVTALLLIVLAAIVLCTRDGRTSGWLIFPSVFVLSSFALACIGGAQASLAYPDRFQDLVAAPEYLFRIVVSLLGGGAMALIMARMRRTSVASPRSVLAVGLSVPPSLAVITVWCWGLRLTWPNTVEPVLLSVGAIVTVALVVRGGWWFAARRWVLGVILAQWLITMAAALLLGRPAPKLPEIGREISSSSREPSTVVLVTVDTLRSDSVFSEAVDTPTPAFDALSADSLVFARAVAPSSWTLPSLASVLTGVAPAVHRADSYQSRLPGAILTLGEVFGREGYVTAVIGRSPFLERGFELTRGFDDARCFPRRWPGVGFATVLFDRIAPWGDATTSELAEIAVRWLESRAAEPVFLWLHFYDPHRPYEPPSRFQPPGDPPRRVGPGFSRFGDVRDGRWVPDRDERRWIRELYEGEVQLVDEALGRIVSFLRESRRYDDAVIVVCSDHGEEFWEHEGYEHGHTLYQEVISVPLWVKAPLRSGFTGVVDVPVTLNAVAPTLLELSGVDYDPSAFSAAVLPGVQDDARFVDSDPVVSRGTLYFDDRESVLIDRFKFIRNLFTGREELYDLQADPGERRSIVDRFPDIVVRAHRALDVERRKAAALRQRLGLADGDELRLDPEARQRLEVLGYTTH